MTQTTRNNHIINVLSILYASSKAGFSYASYVAQHGVGRMAAAATDLVDAEIEGMIIPEDESTSNFLFTDAFISYMEAETPEDASAPFTPDDDIPPALFPYTAIITHPNKTDTMHVYFHRHVEAECPADATDMIAKIMDKTKQKDKWHMIALMEGAITPVDPKSNISPVGNMTWVEIDDDGEIRSVYSSVPGTSWCSVSWDDMLAYGSMDEIENDDPDLYSRISEFNAWCLGNGYNHKAGVENVKYLLEHPLASIPGTMAAMFDEDSAEFAEMDEMLERNMREEMSDAYRGGIDD